jgi:mannose-6-phosphate isomerase-like protein (cupin superfamily)
MKISFVGVILALGVASSLFAQQTSRPGTASQPSIREDALDPSPVDPKSDPDIDMFVNDYRHSTPHTEFGAMVFYDILTPRGAGDIMHPVAKGAVLSVMIAASRATLEAGATATGRVQPGRREVFIDVEGAGTISVQGKTYPVAPGSYFQLTPDLDFSLTNTGRTPMVFYVRIDPLPANFKIPAFDVVNRYENDRVFGAHWTHSCDMVPSGPTTKVFPPMTFCSMSPYSMPQPHSHPGEEVWIQVEGVTTLSLGKRLMPLRPGQAYRIPPDGMTAHSNINLSDRMTKLLYLGPIDRAADSASVIARGISLVPDYSRLDNRPLDPPTEQDAGMYIANWHDAFPQIRYGNMYVRDMLISLSGSDPLHPTRTGAVLSNATMVRYGLLEPYSKAHPVHGEESNIQQVFIVNSGDGLISSGGKTIALSRDKVVIVPPGVQYSITAGSDYMTFYIVGEKLPEGSKPAPNLSVIDHRSNPAKTADWVDTEHTLASKEDGLCQFTSVARVDMSSEMAMARPTSTAAGVEEIWIATDGNVDMLFGRHLRKLPAGTAYRVPPTGNTARAHINTSGNPASFIRLLK